MLGVVKAA